MLLDKDNGYAFGDPGDWFSARWPCKGGDWKRSDDAQDRSSRKKLVLNDGFSLCEMPKSGCEDPRWPQKDDLYYPSQSRRLDLPPWAFCADERADSGTVSRTAQTKSLARGVIDSCSLRGKIRKKNLRTGTYQCSNCYDV